MGVLELKAGRNRACGLASLPVSWWRELRLDPSLPPDEASESIMLVGTDTTPATAVALQGYH